MTVCTNPVAFFLLLAFPILLLLRKTGLFVPPSFTIVLADWGENPNDNMKKRSILKIVSDICFFTAWCFFVIALSDPEIIDEKKIYTSAGADIVFVLDTSPSMAAKDIAFSTRLAAAKKAIAFLVKNNDANSYGLAAFGSEAALIVPTTMDRFFFLNRLESLIIGELGSDSAIGTGVATAVWHLSSKSSPSKTIILLTDGENNGGVIHPETAVKLARQNNIHLYICGIGTNGSVPLEYVDPITGKRYSGYIEASFDDNNLRNLALEESGEYFTIHSLEKLSEALNYIGTERSVFQRYRLDRHGIKLYEKCLLIALIAFVLGFFMRRVLLHQII